jgi:hypothetical protein
MCDKLEYCKHPYPGNGISKHTFYIYIQEIITSDFFKAEDQVEPGPPNRE